MRGSVPLSSEPPYQEQLESEIESLRQQLILKEHQYDVMKASAEVLAEQCDKMRQQLETSQKREVMLRDALEYHQAQTRPIQRTEEALAATADLDGLILCEKKPVAWLRDDDKGGSINTMSDCCTDAVKELLLRVNPNNVERYTIPLYRAKEQGK